MVCEGVSISRVKENVHCIITQIIVKVPRVFIRKRSLQEVDLLKSINLVSDVYSTGLNRGPTLGKKGGLLRSLFIVPSYNENHCMSKTFRIFTKFKDLSQIFMKTFRIKIKFKWSLEIRCVFVNKTELYYGLVVDHLFNH